MSYTAPEAARIAGISYRQLDGPCREYPGSRNERGYARRKFHGVRMYVHRYVWEMANGPIPIGMCVLHRCDNPSCFRLSHLFLGTRRENSEDMVAKGRNTQHGVVRLPEAKIIKLYIDGWSLRRIAHAIGGCTSEGVRGVLLRHSVPLRTNNGTPRPRWS